jgi:hypothetical protein
MTDTKHTPGPWAVCPDGRLTPGATVPVYSASDAEGLRLTVALVRTIGPEGDADARLIAAAPELLAALEEFCRECDGYLDGNDGRPWGTLLKGRAAIAKATGE